MKLVVVEKMEDERIREDIQLPIIDLSSSDRSQTAKLIVKACEDLGFFKVINHGVPQEIISRMEDEARLFFSRPGSEKRRAGPYGYGCHNIGFNGDTGELEYLLLQPNPLQLSRLSRFISADDPNRFSCAVSSYVDCVKELACELLDLMAEGLLWPAPGRQAATSASGSALMSGLVRDTESDSLLRLNHYPPAPSKIGFGPHTDPQILTLLRSDGSDGLQISLEDGSWVPVSPLPQSAFCVNVGDMLQVMTSGRFHSVRHRAVVNEFSSRTSIAYFAAPPLNATISCRGGNPLYRSFTWGEYKKAAYTSRLDDNRLNLFKLHKPDDDDDAIIYADSQSFN